MGLGGFRKVARWVEKERKKWSELYNNPFHPTLGLGIALETPEFPHTNFLLQLSRPPGYNSSPTSYFTIVSALKR
jgi:hypothetical protein